ncbi:MAG: hypothetical protein RLZZ283_255 [Candidatus Parcubacteria bacterium]|jgi:hypothetical protein
MAGLVESADILAGLLVKRQKKAELRRQGLLPELKPNSIELARDWKEYNLLSALARSLFERAPHDARPALRRRIGEATGHYPTIDGMVSGVDRYDLTPRRARLNMKSPVRRIVTLKHEDGKLRAESRKL